METENCQGRPSTSEAVLMTRANNLGLKGWVRNNPDESVEGAAVGPKAKIDDLYVPSTSFFPILSH